MDYGVKYKILLNGTEAANDLTKFQNSVGKAIPKINKQFDSLNKRIERTITLLGKLGGSIKASGSAMSMGIGGKKETDNLKRANRELEKRIKLQSKSVSITRGGNIGIGSGALGMLSTVGIGYGLVSLIKEASAFENTMTTVRNILGTTDKEATTFDARFASVSKNMRELGVNTKFTANEIASATKFLAMAGMNLDQIDKSMKTVTSLAAIGDAALGETADIITNISTGYGVAANDIGKVGDIIASTTSRSNVSILEMGESMKYAAGWMRLAGVDFREGAAAIGVLGNAGIKGTLAGTAMRAMLIRLISPTNQAQKVIDRLGVTFTKMTTEGGKTREIVKPLKDVFGELKAAGATAADLNKIFGKIGGGAATNIISNIESLTKLTTAGEGAGGLADFLAEEKMKTVVGLSQQLNSKFQDLGLTLFEKIEPKLREVMGGLLDWMKTDEAESVFNSISSGINKVIAGVMDLGRFISKNWDYLKVVLAGVGVLTAGRNVSAFFTNVGASVASLGASFMKLPGAIMASTTTLSSLFASATPFLVGGAVIVGVGALTLGFIELTKYANSLNREVEVLSENKDVLSDWSLAKTGMNTESLDLLEKKMATINRAGRDLLDVQEKMKPSVVDQKLKESLQIYADRFQGQRTGLSPGGGYAVGGFGRASSTELTTGISDIVRSAAIGDKRVVAGKEMYLAALREKDPIKRQRILSGMQASAIVPSGLPSVKDVLSKTTGATDLGVSQLKGTREYRGEISRAILTRRTQAVNIFEALKGGGRVGGLSALDEMLGGEIDLTDVRTTMLSRGSKTREEINAVLKKINTSIPAIRQSLLGQGISSSFIDTVLKQAGFLPAIDTTIKSKGALDRLTTGDIPGATKDGIDPTDVSGKRRSGGKMVVVNIDNFMSVDTVNTASEEELENFKGRMADALKDIVKDFEENYN